MAKIDTETLAYALKDLANTAHMMSLGFQAYRDDKGMGCLNVIEARIDQIMESYGLDKEIKSIKD